MDRTRTGEALNLGLVDCPGPAETALVAVDIARLKLDRRPPKQVCRPRRRPGGHAAGRRPGLVDRNACLVRAKALPVTGIVERDVIAPTRTARDGSPIQAT